MVLGMFGKCCSKSWKNPNILFRQLCKPVSRLRSGRHKPADNSRHAFFLSRFISLHQSVQSQGSSMLVKINDSHLLVNSTIVNVRNLSRQKVFSRSFFLYLNMAVFYVQKSELSQSGGLFSAFRFFPQVQFFFLIVWLLSSRFQTDNTKLKFQTNLQIEFLSIVDIYLSYLCATFLLFSFLFIFLALNLTNFVPMELSWNCLLFWRITDNFCDFF